MCQFCAQELPFRPGITWVFTQHTGRINQFSAFNFIQIAHKVFAKLAATMPQLFISHMAEVRRHFEEIIGKHQMLGSSAPEDMNFVHIVINMLPVLVQNTEAKYKHEVYGMIERNASNLGDLIRHEHVCRMFECLRIGIRETESDIRYAAYNAFIKCSMDFVSVIFENGFAVEILENLFDILRDACDSDGIKLEHGNDGYPLQFSALQSVSERLKENIVPRLVLVMERLLSSLDPARILYFGIPVVKTISVTFGWVTQQDMQPFYPQLKSKIREFLIVLVTNQEDSFQMRQLAESIGDNEFMLFIADIAFELMDQSIGNQERANFYSFFAGMGVLFKGNDPAAFLRKIVMPMLASVEMNQSDDVENVETFHAEKKNAIVGLASLAQPSGAYFEPYFQMSFDAIFGQLTNPEAATRVASVEALSTLIEWSAHTNQIEFSQQAAAQIIPHYTRVLKEDNSYAVALSVLNVYRHLMQKSMVIVFNGKMQLFNEVLTCVSDVMDAKAVCQADVDFYENCLLIDTAIGVFLDLCVILQPFEFAVYFSSILPVLRAKLEDAKQNESQKSKSFREMIYGTLKSSIRVAKAYTSTVFDTLFPLLLSGIRDEYHLARKNVVIGLCELLLHAGEKANEQSAQVSREFSELFDREECGDVVIAACRGLALLIHAKSKLISIAKYLPILVENLKTGHFEFLRDEFQCFHLLLNENNGVLLTLLNQIVWIGFEYLNSGWDLDTKEAVKEFLKECRRKYGHLIEQALIEDPSAAGIVQLL